MRIRRSPAHVAVAVCGVALVGVALSGLGADTVQARPDSRPPDRAPRPVDDWAEATVSCRFQQLGDPVRLSGGPGSVAVARGGWRHGTCPVPKAKVSVRLQARHDGEWRDLGDTASATVASGRRTQATFVCHNTKPTRWRSVVDVDLIDSSDDADQLTTPARTLRCCPDPALLDGHH